MHVSKFSVVLTIVFAVASLLLGAVLIRSLVRSSTYSQISTTTGEGMILFINDHEISSNKPGGVSTWNDVVTWTDGSTCNVSAGTCINKGIGFIVMDGATY